MKLTSFGQMNNETAKFIYKMCRQLVDAMIRNGKLDQGNADKEWATMVAKQLRSGGIKVPEKIRKLIR